MNQHINICTSSKLIIAKYTYHNRTIKLIFVRVIEGEKRLKLPINLYKKEIIREMLLGDKLFNYLSPLPPNCMTSIMEL